MILLLVIIRLFDRLPVGSLFAHCVLLLEDCPRVYTRELAPPDLTHWPLTNRVHGRFSCPPNTLMVTYQFVYSHSKNRAVPESLRPMPKIPEQVPPDPISLNTFESSCNYWNIIMSYGVPMVARCLPAYLSTSEFMSSEVRFSGLFSVFHFSISGDSENESFCKT